MAGTRRTDSISPAPQPALTKRDVRRNRMMDKLQSMMDSFAGNQHQHYRAQMQAIQADMNLILRADPYDGLPLDESAEELRAAVDSMSAGVALDEAAQRDYTSMAGSRYRAFVKEVNDAIEQRDADLTVLHNRYEQSVAELERTTQQKLHQAEEEHKALSNTVRQRLITTITKRKQQLLRDKEQLDIAESNAALLHPSQFTLTVPGSPGGPNRKTRHLRHRNTSPGGDEAAKRKRKAAAMDEEGNESPGPGYRPLPPPDNLGGGRSPFKDAREKNAYAQYEAPAYSLERIFTDKELALATDTARMATYRYFHQPQTTTDSVGNTNGTAGSSVIDDAAADGEDMAENLDGAGTPPPAAMDMERSASHQVLTRGHARANPLAALSDLAVAAASASGNGTAALRDNPFAPVVPTFHAVTRSEKTGAPTPPTVSQLDLENDFEMMRRSGYEGNTDATGSYSQANEAKAMAGAYEMRQSLLDQALNGPSSASQPYRLQLLNQGAASIGKGVDRIPATGYAPVSAAGVLEQRLRAQTNGSNLASVLRGEPMSRATSAAGSEIGENGPVRGRRRAAV